MMTLGMDLLVNQSVEIPVADWGFMVDSVFKKRIEVSSVVLIRSKIKNLEIWSFIKPETCVRFPVLTGSLVVCFLELIKQIIYFFLSIETDKDLQCVRLETLFKLSLNLHKLI